MDKKYKIILIACCIALLCNVIAKIHFVNRQSTRITILQKVVAAARSGNYIKADMLLPETPDHANDLQRIFEKLPEEFLFTEYAAQIRSLIDTNHLQIENSLVFKPEKSDLADVLNYSTNISATGSYNGIKNLVSDFQNLPGIVYFDSPNMIKVKDQPNMVSLNMRLFVFFKRGKV